MAVGLPQEIWDKSLDFLDDPRDLRSCALVSRSLRPRAQSHLFHDITLVKPGYNPIDDFFDHDPTDDQFDDGAACRRLVSVLDVSPHLARHIRRIRIPFRKDFLTHVCGMRLSRLRDIGFSSCPPSHYHIADDPLSSTLDLAHSLVALPSIRSVQLEVQKWPFDNTGPGFAFKVMSRLFKNPTPHIQA
ncbi:hypothetical protein FB451DRAFT_197732 [Mycena latifolia]|nr:hypothetical protein FB451DRAFT_197732 [Mycena latifolia]